MNRARAALAFLLAAVTCGGCSILTSSEADQMQKDIASIKLDINRLKEAVADNNAKVQYSLMAIEEKLDIREESIGSTLRNVDERLANVETVSRQGETPAATGAVEGLKAGPTGVAPSGVDASAGASRAAVSGLSPEQLFLEATQAWVDRNFDRAQSLYEQFLAEFPTHPRAGEALFWIGESHYSKEEFPLAIEAYQKVIDQFPGSRMEAEAAAKIGYCYYRTNQTDKARQSLQMVVDRYPTYGQIGRVKETLESLQPK